MSEKRIALVLCVLLPFELSVYLQRKLEPNFRNIFFARKVMQISNLETVFESQGIKNTRQGW